MRILFIGDIVGKKGLEFLKEKLPELKATYKPNLIFVNAENTTNGKGLNLRDYKEVLKQSITCSNGKKYIAYQSTSEVKKDEAEDNFTGDMYWSENFDIVCTNIPTGDYVEAGNGNNNNNNNGYNSSQTTENEKQGVETYYIILGVVGLVAYLVSTIVKKQNLFKKV